MGAIVKPGMHVTYNVAVSVVAVSEARLKARPDDQEMLGQQVDYREEEGGILDSMNYEFRQALDGMRVDEIKSVVCQYPEWQAESVVVLPFSVLAEHTDDLAPGSVIGLDVLKDKVKIDEFDTELEVIQIREQKGERFVVCDSNEWHAGLKVRYDIEVLEVRKPTEEELRIEALS